MTTAVAKSKKAETIHEPEEKQSEVTTKRVVVPEYQILRKEGGYEIRAELPGVAERALEITVKDRLLTLKGQTAPLEFEGLRASYSEFTAVDYAAGFRLSDDIDDESIGAILKNGMLTVSLPKYKERQPRTIQVNIAQTS
jgi:HSP20 family molecular chaperone IbpA